MTETADIEITVNGSDRRLAAGRSVAELISELGKDPRSVAVEYNGRILPRDGYKSTELQSGDSLEVVQRVQGGRARSRSWETTG